MDHPLLITAIVISGCAFAWTWVAIPKIKTYFRELQTRAIESRAAFHDWRDSSKITS